MINFLKNNKIKNYFIKNDNKTIFYNNNDYDEEILISISSSFITISDISEGNII